MRLIAIVTAAAALATSCLGAEGGWPDGPFPYRFDGESVAAFPDSLPLSECFGIGEGCVAIDVRYGRLVPFHSDVEDVTGWSVDLTMGDFGFGFRFDWYDMQSKEGEDLEARSYLLLFGGGEVSESGWGFHMYYSLGLSVLEYEDNDEAYDVAGGLIIGGRRNFGGRDSQAGITAEANFFFADPDDVELDGVGLMLGGYVRF